MKTEFTIVEINSIENALRFVKAQPEIQRTLQTFCQKMFEAKLQKIDLSNNPKFCELVNGLLQTTEELNQGLLKEFRQGRRI